MQEPKKRKHFILNFGAKIPAAAGIFSFERR